MEHNWTFKHGEFSFEPIKKTDLEWARNLHNDPEVVSMLTDPHEVTSEQQQAWFKRLRNSNSSKYLIVRRDRERIGIIRLNPIDHANHNIMIGLDIHKEHRGKHYAKPIYRGLLDFCFNQLNMHRVHFKVAEYNARAFKLYRELGFKEEGRERQSLHRFGKFHDYIVMGMLKPEYNALK